MRTSPPSTKRSVIASSDDIGAQIDLIGVPWLMIGYEPSAAPNGGSRVVAAASDYDTA
jgi:hypothetical protein